MTEASVHNDEMDLECAVRCQIEHNHAKRTWDVSSNVYAYWKCIYAVQILCGGLEFEIMKNIQKFIRNHLPNVPISMSTTIILRNDLGQDQSEVSKKKTLQMHILTGLKQHRFQQQTRLCRCSRVCGNGL